MNKIFIIGGGIAALSAARAARQQDLSALIVLISEENALPYSRPMLTKQMLGKVTAQDLAVESFAWYEEQGIVALTGRQVTKVDVANHTLTAGGTEFAWDKLIFATGASCFVPPIPGSTNENVMTIRQMDDVEKVRRAAKTAKNAVVIGGGVLGLEAASSLQEAGIHVTVLEYSKQLMQRQIDQQAAQEIEAAMASKGVQLITGAETTAIDETGVTLADGRHIAADLVIVSAGVRANLSLAKAAGVATNRHITVDCAMRTNLPEVYAAGDCASMGVSYALWAEASDMGRVAGANAAGGAQTYQAVARPLVFHGFGTELFAMGDCGKQEGVQYEIGQMPGARYYSLNGRLVGAVLTGDISRQQSVEALLLSQEA